VGFEWIIPLVTALIGGVCLVLKSIWGLDKPQTETVTHALPEVEIAHATPEADRAKLDELGV
jgi:hypothetical protein